MPADGSLRIVPHLWFDTQADIDAYWERLSAVPEAEQCGWLKDRFGLSWQIVPKDLNVLMERGSPAQKQAVTKAVLGMKKLDVRELRRAFDAAASMDSDADRSEPGSR